jgi:hypothetical protein
VATDDLWKIAREDAELSVDPLLLAFAGTPPPDADWARHFPPQSTAGMASPYSYDEWQAIDDPATLHRHRVALYIHRDERVVLAMMRHELEHVCQAEASRALYETAEIVHASLGPVYGPVGLAGSRSVYNVVPIEREANRASARLVRKRFGRPEHALRYGEHGVLFREPPKEPRAPLGRRLLAFASLHPLAFEQTVAARGHNVDPALNTLDAGGSRLWPRLVSDQRMVEARRRMQAAIPTAAAVAAAGARPAAAWDALVAELRAGERRALQMIAPPWWRRLLAGAS